MSRERGPSGITKMTNEQEKKIRNKVKELHNQTALYLCRNYKRIMVPEFKTQPMISDKIAMKKKIDIEQAVVKELTDETKALHEIRDLLSRTITSLHCSCGRG